MKRPLGYTVIAVFALAFSFFALMACFNTGDLFVRAFLILAAGTAFAAGMAVWKERPKAARLVAIWSLTTTILGSAIFAYSRYYTLRGSDQSIARNAIVVAVIAALCAAYLERRPTTVRGEG